MTNHKKYTVKKQIVKHSSTSSLKTQISKSVMKISILYSQTLRIKRICSKTTDFEYHLQELKERFKVTTKNLPINISQKSK